MAFSGSRIYEAEVLFSHPTTHTVTVRLASATEVEPLECCVLMTTGGGSSKSHGLSLPKVGATVLVLIDKIDNAVVLGILPKASLGSEPSGLAKEENPIGARIRGTNFRGEDAADIYPGDISLRADTSRVHLSDNELTVKAGRSKLEMSDIFGHSHLHTTAESVTHKNSLFTYKVLSPGGDASPTMDLHAFTQEPDRQSSLEHVYQADAGSDLHIEMNAATPLGITYTGNSEAAVTIDSTGKLLLKGSSVTINAGGFVQTWGGDEVLDRTYATNIKLGTTQNMALSANGSLEMIGGTTAISGDNAVKVTSGGNLAITAGGITKGIPFPGKDQVLAINAPQGAIEIKAGSFFPGPGSLTKPGVRIQSDGGGDIHLDSRPTPGGVFTTGAVVIDSALPASTSLSGGPGGYGLVLNSPLIHIGGIPGVSDTPAGLPGLWAPPVPPIYDGPVKHFSYMSMYTPIMTAGIAAGLAAAFPPFAGFSVPLFTGPAAVAAAILATPPIGRPLTVHMQG
jgi:hypothetical protein